MWAFWLHGFVSSKPLVTRDRRWRYFHHRLVRSSLQDHYPVAIRDTNNTQSHAAFAAHYMVDGKLCALMVTRGWAVITRSCGQGGCLQMWLCIQGQHQNCIECALVLLSSGTMEDFRFSYNLQVAVKSCGISWTRCWERGLVCQYCIACHHHQVSLLCCWASALHHHLCCTVCCMVAKAVCGWLVSIERLRFYGTLKCV